jgi:hypothetical protein
MFGNAKCWRVPFQGESIQSVSITYPSTATDLWLLSQKWQCHSYLCPSLLLLKCSMLNSPVLYLSHSCDNRTYKSSKPNRHGFQYWFLLTSNSTMDKSLQPGEVPCPCIANKMGIIIPVSQAGSSWIKTCTQAFTHMHIYNWKQWALKNSSSGRHYY